MIGTILILKKILQFSFCFYSACFKTNICTALRKNKRIKPEFRPMKTSENKNQDMSHF